MLLCTSKQTLAPNRKNNPYHKKNLMLIYFDKTHLLKILKYFPGFLIFLGSLKLIIFFNAFNIRIVEYLDFSEVLISFFDSVIFYSAIVIIPAFIFLSFWGKAIGEHNTQTYNSLAQLTFKQRLSKSYGEDKFFFICGLLYTVSIFFFGNWNEHKLALLLMFPGVYIIFFILQEIRIAYQKQYNYSIPITYFNVFVFLTLLTIYIIQDALNDVYEIKVKKKYLGSEIQMNDQIIKSDSTVSYVGQTKNYIFFYNLKKNESIVYPKSQLRSIKLVQN